MTLEELLRDTARRGELNHLSLIPSPKGFCATYCPASKCTHNTAIHADPVEALRLAMRTKRTEMDFG